MKKFKKFNEAKEYLLSIQWSEWYNDDYSDNGHCDNIIDIANNEYLKRSKIDEYREWYKSKFNGYPEDTYFCILGIKELLAMREEINNPDGIYTEKARKEGLENLKIITLDEYIKENQD